jgi:hypothetical protein
MKPPVAASAFHFRRLEIRSRQALGFVQLQEIVELAYFHIVSAVVNDHGFAFLVKATFVTRRVTKEARRYTKEINWNNGTVASNIDCASQSFSNDVIYESQFQSGYRDTIDIAALPPRPPSCSFVLPS